MFLLNTLHFKPKISLHFYPQIRFEFSYINTHIYSMTTRFSCFIWSQKVELSQDFCEMPILPKINVEWNCSAKINLNEIWHMICGISRADKYSQECYLFFSWFSSGSSRSSGSCSSDIIVQYVPTQVSMQFKYSLPITLPFLKSCMLYSCCFSRMWLRKLKTCWKYPKHYVLWVSSSQMI